MASVSFYLKNPKEVGKEQLIYLFFFYGNSKPLKYSTGEKVLPEHWDAKKQRIKERRTIKLSMYTNLILDKYDAKIKEIFKKLLLGEGAVTDNVLREELDIVFHKKKREKKLQMMEYFSLLVKEKEEMNTKDKSAYKSLYEHLKDYEQKTHTKLQYENMTLDFLEKFIYYLQNIKSKYGREYKKSTINAYIERLKAFLGLATQQGYNTTFFYKSRNFTHGKEKVEKEPLTEEELEKIYRCDLSGCKVSWEHIRDTYIIGACTLLRHSDYNSLKPEHISGDFIVRHTKKKGKTVMLPTHEWIREIMQKYNGKLPPSYSNSYMNLVLPKIGKLAGINKNVVVSYTSGGERIEKVIPKYELIKSHSARRSGANILKEQNIPLLDIQKMLTHENIQTTMGYLYVDMEEAAKRVKNAPFFDRKNTDKK